MKNQEKNIRLFKSDFLEYFTHVHPIMPISFWVPVCVFFIWRGFAIHDLSVWAVMGVGVLALLFWSAFEYFLHRVVFHYEAKSKIGKRIVYLFHGVHHDDPQDGSRLLMPLLPGSLLGLVMFLLFRMVWGPALCEPFFAFFITGYLIYDYTHYFIHHRVPKTKYGKYLHRNHLLHHYKFEDSFWGVSTPLWDFIFGTTRQPMPSKVKTKNKIEA